MKSKSPQIKVLITCIALLLVFDLLAKSILYIGVGTQFKVDKDDFDPTPSSLENINVTAEYTDPVTGASAKSSLKVVSVEGDEITLLWNKNIKLYDEKSVRGKLLSEALSASPSPAPDLELASLKIDESVYQDSVYLCQPFVWNLSGNPLSSVSDGDVYNVTGKFLGDKKCKVYLEYQDSKGKAKYKSCKIVKKSFEVDDTTGVTSCQIVYPKLPSGSEISGYFIFKTKSGVTAVERTKTDSELASLYDTESKDVKANFAEGKRTANQVINKLKAVNPYDSNVIWNKNKDRVLVLTWQSSNYWNETVYTIGTEYDNNYSATWVSLAPELKEYGHKYKFALIKNSTGAAVGDSVNYKLTQIMGMPPNVWQSTESNPKDVIVELWAKPESLFRPSPDPEITDHESEVWFDYETYGANLIQYDKTFTSAADSPFTNFNKFKTWLKGELTTEINPYPFTGFGYTYFWGNSKSNYGVSEFIIPGKWDDVYTGKFIVNRFVKPVDYFSEDDEAYKESPAYLK